jgi:hypothetical protein
LAVSAKDASPFCVSGDVPRCRYIPGRDNLGFSRADRDTNIARNGKPATVFRACVPNEAPELALHTDRKWIDESVARGLAWLERRGLTPCPRASATAAAAHASYW